MTAADRPGVAAALLALARSSDACAARAPSSVQRVSAPGHPLPDSAGKYLVLDDRGVPVAFGFEASDAAPGAVARDVRKARQARDRLGASLGRSVVNAIAEGTLDGASLALYPVCVPLPAGWLRWRLQRPAVQEWVLEWLRGVAAATATALADATERARMFERPLEHLAAMTSLTPALRADAQVALERLGRDRWTPRRLLMHGDLWSGNILARPAEARSGAGREYAVIDWGASEVDGYALFDLVRVAQSLDTSSARLRRELDRHAQVLGCDPVDARGYVLAALGHRALNLEFFPLDRFARMAGSCHETIVQLT